MGKGPTDTDYMIIGETPESSGRAEKVLTKALHSMGVRRDSIYITHAVHCYTPNGKSPKKAYITACKPWLEKEIEAVNPKYVLLLGNAALVACLGQKGIKKLRGRPVVRDGRAFMPTYQPGFILRTPRAETLFQADINYWYKMSLGQQGSDSFKWTLVDTPDKFAMMVKDIHGTVSFDVETNGTSPWHGEVKEGKGSGGKTRTIIGTPRINSLGIGTGRMNWALPLMHPKSPWLWDECRGMMEILNRRMADCVLVAQNGKFDTLWIKVIFGIEWLTDFDTLLAHYLVDENSFHGLDVLATIFFGVANYDIPLQEKFGYGPLDRHCEYLARDVYYTRKLRYLLGPEIRSDWGTAQIFDHVLMPCASLFVGIQYKGVPINPQKLYMAREHLLAEVASVKRRLQDWETSDTFNWNSDAQVRTLLFEVHGLEPLDLTDGGQASVCESVLKRLEHPIAEDLITLRKALKNLSFITSWEFFQVDWWMHPTFLLHGTVTGRPSCKDPNLQQVPRIKLLRSIIGAHPCERHMPRFLLLVESGDWSACDTYCQSISTCPECYEMIEIDLSQIELRIAAEMSADPTMLQIFDEGKDPHWTTALRELARTGAEPELVIGTACAWEGVQGEMSYTDAINVLLDMGVNNAIAIEKDYFWNDGIFESLWKNIRKKAKAINFGYLYGMWWKKFITYARDNYGVIVTDAQAEASRVAFFEIYSRLDRWHRRQKKVARRDGEVRSLSGRLRHLPAALSSVNSPERKEAERQAVNSPVQEFAATLNLMVALQLKEEFKGQLHLAGTIHDAILIVCRRKQILPIAKRANEVMTGPKLLDELEIMIRVPLQGDVEIGPWGSGESVPEWQSKQVKAV